MNEQVKEAENAYVQFVVKVAKELDALKPGMTELPLWGKLVKENGHWKLMYGFSSKIHEAG